MKKLLLVLAFFLLTPTAFAVSSHTYTCADLNDGSNPSCGGSPVTWTFTGGSFPSLYDDADAFPLTVGTWYVSLSYAVNTTGATWSIGCASGGTCDSPPTFVAGTGSVVDAPVVVTGGTGGLYIYTATGYNGTISNVTISDTCASCSTFTPFIASILWFL